MKTLASLHRWLELLGIPRQDRADLAQDVMLAAYRSFPSYDPERARPERWLNRIAVFVASHHRERAVHRREQLAPEGAQADRAGEDQDPEERLAAAQQRGLARRLLEALDAGERAVLMAHDIEETAMAEIAARLGIPLSTAYKWRARAIAAARARAALPGEDKPARRRRRRRRP